MQIDVHHIETHITRATSPQHRIEIGTIVIHQRTTAMDQLCNRRNAGLKESEGIGIGHHHGGDGVAF